MKWLINWFKNKKKLKEYNRGRKYAADILNDYPEGLALQKLVRAMGVADDHISQGIQDEIDTYRARQKGLLNDHC